jgi:hypothetical protein
MTCADRLAELLENGAQHDQATQIQTRKAEIDRLRERYLKRHDRKQPIRDAVEMAKLAEQLGRQFEARVFLSIAISEDPGRTDLLRDLERLTTNRLSGSPAEVVSATR